MIEKPSFIIGRSSEADITLNDELLSRKHLKISFSAEAVWLEELGSGNGSWLDGQKLKTNKPLAYTPKAKIVLGKNNGPVISIEVVTRQIAEEMVEEVTLVRRNPLLDQVVVLRSEPVAAPAAMAPIIKKVANGYDQAACEPKITVSKIQLVDSAPHAEPDLILRMKNMLNSEAETVIKNAKAEAEKILSDAKKLAKSEIDQAKKVSADLKLKTELETKSAKKFSDDEIEKLRFANAQSINGLLESASKQSQVLLLNSRKEADGTLEAAKKFADELITQNRTRAENSIKETDYIVQLKLDELKRSEEEIQLNTKILEEMYRELKTKVDLLKRQEQDTRNIYESLSKNIEREESRMNSERSSLESLRSQVLYSQKECDQQLADLNLEERRLKTQMETELLEQKLKVTQVQSEFQQAQLQRDTISAEINFLKQGKDQAEQQIRETEAEHQKAIRLYESAVSQEAEALFNLAQLKTEQQNIQMDIEQQKNDLALSKEQLQKEKKQIAELRMKTEERASDSAETIKNAQRLMEKQKSDHATEMENDQRAFEKQKLELAYELEAERKNLQKTLKDEALRIKLGHEEEIKKIIEQKSLAIIKANETKLETEKAIKKSSEEMLKFQRSMKNKNEALKNEAQREFLQSKEKLEQLSISAHKKQEESKNLALSELKLIEKEKTNLQKSIKDLSIDHEKKLLELERDLKLEIDKAKKKASQIEKDLVAEAMAQKIVMEKFKQDELREIQLLKENALKDIYGKKNERARLVSIAVDTNVLDELNKYKFKKINDVFIDTFSKRISTIVFETVMEKYSADKQKLEDARQLAAKNLERVLYFKKIFKRICLVLFLTGFTYAAFQVYKSPDFIPVKAKIDKGIQSLLSVDFINYLPK